MDEFTSALKSAWTEYKKLKKSRIHCPALHGERVYFSNLGWNHLIGNRHVRGKTESDVLHRFQILKFVVDIIETGKLGQSRNRDNKKYLSLRKKYDNRVYRVVLGEDEKKKYTFISVIDVT
jgi:hypothetical protein